MKIVVVGGGSAGHVLPTLPIIEALASEGAEVLFIGTRSGLEASLVANAPCRYAGISAGKLRRYFSLENVVDLLRILLGIIQALVIVLKFRPDVIFSKGGFVSFPVAFAGWLARVPIVAHESDITTGLANRLVIPFAKTLCTSFASTTISKGGLRVVHTGTPLRAAILNGDADKGRATLGLERSEGLIVVTGGSLGADGLNTLVRDALPELTQLAHVFHVCGEGKVRGTQIEQYREVEYVDQGWGDVLAAADVVVSRAGANALFELVALAKKNVLVPLPRKASRGDQIDNAAHAEAEGWSVVLDEEHATAEQLVAAVRALLEQGAEFVDRMTAVANPNSTNAIVMEIHDACGKSS